MVLRESMKRIIIIVITTLLLCWDVYWILFVCSAYFWNVQYIFNRSILIVLGTTLLPITTAGILVGRKRKSLLTSIVYFTFAISISVVWWLTLGP